ncbi:Tumor protein D54 [Frankliniella fusca]|uniref:Tumor protein D54 n=1 Tax=Frankliniella fusca TaxID=407009 RepID=A0AAE1I3N6_9NEOP|nr:Tumor protein D54 [Frankliniella fusca]
MSVPVGQEPSTDMLSPDSGVSELQGLTPEEAEKQKEEWRNQLAELENEIQTMRFVLASKVKQSQELKRKLGFSVWRELTDDVSQGLRNVKESNVYQSVEEKIGQFSKAVAEQPVYQKTESVVKATAEKTTSILGGLGSGITMKLGQLKNSESFRSLEEKVGSAYENVKTKVSTSRSSSMQSFDEALRETEYKKGSTATTPTIPEDRPIS